MSRLFVNQFAGEYPHSGHPDWPYNAIIVDINSDGYDDAWESSGSTSQIWLNDGMGAPSPQGFVLPGGDQISAADFNGDSYLDLYIYSSLSGQIAFGDGTGVFTTNGQIITGSQMGLSSHGDFDGDGDQDLLVPNTNLNQVTIWENDGQGLLAASSNLATGPATQAFAADLNLDGHEDILLSLREGETGQAIWLNNNTISAPVGLMLSVVGPQTGNNCHWYFSSLVSGSDIEASWRFSDGGAAIGATARHCYTSGDTHQAWLTASNDLGVVTDTIRHTSPNGPTPTAYLHISGNMRLLQPIEISVISHTGHLGSLHYGDGHVSWSPSAQYSHIYTEPGRYDIRLNLALPGQPVVFVTKTVDLNPFFVPSAEDFGLEEGFADNIIKVHPGDFDNDGTIDVLVSGNIIGSQLWRNDGTGRFTYNQQLVETQNFAHTDVGDIDGDGHLDIVSTGVTLPGFGGYGHTFINTGTGHFYAGQRDIFSGADASFVRLADFDGDNDLDAFVGYSTTNTMDQIFWNDGTGQFASSGTFFSGISTRDFAVVDLNGDNHLDIVLASDIEGTQVWMNDGSGLFTRSLQTLSDSYYVAAGDMNGDGTPDIVTAPQDWESRSWFDIWLNDGSGQFFLLVPSVEAEPQRYRSAFGGIPYRVDIELGDIDLDGDLDVIVGDNDGVWASLLNDGRGYTTLTVVEYRRPLMDIALADLDGDSDLDLLFGISIPPVFSGEEPDYPVQTVWFNNHALEPITGVVVGNTSTNVIWRQNHLLADVGSGNDLQVQWEVSDGQSSSR